MTDAIGRAYSLLEIKSFDDDERVIEGLASTPSPDRMDDIVESAGAQFKLPMPLLWQHRHDQPVGHVTFAEATKDGIPFKAKLVKIDEPGELKTLTDKAWQSVRTKPPLVGAVSIGFRAIEAEPIKDSKNFGVRFKRWEWLELSLVTIPANTEATIQVVRSIDSEVLAASGRKSAPDKPATLPASRGSVVRIQEAKMAATAKTITEQISAFEATRQAKAARMTEIMEKSAEEQVTLDAPQQEEYDGLETDVRKVDEHLVRLRKLEETNKAAAKPINGHSEQAGSELRSGNGASVISVKRNLPPGIPFVRYGARSQWRAAIAWRRSKSPSNGRTSTPEVETVLRAAVAAGTTTDATWAAPLVVYQQMAGEFIELLRTQTILGRIQGLRRVPFNISIPVQTAGTMAQWVGELISKPVSKLAFSSMTLRFTKVANIVVMSDELVRFSNPSAEAIVRDDLVKGVAEFLDQQFTNPSIAEVTNVSPASITNGAPNHAATGTTADALRNDLKLMLASFATANIPPQGLTVLMESNIAASVAMMMNRGPTGIRQRDAGRWIVVRISDHRLG